MLALAASALTARAQNQDDWKVVGQIGGPTQGIAVQGNYAYTGVGMRLVVLDVSNPSDLREAGATPPFSNFLEDVAISGTLAYVAAGDAGLRVVDVSNAALPTEIGALDSRGIAQGVAIAGTIAYLANGPYGLRLVDVSNPSHPVELGSAYPMNYAFDVAVQGHYAYIAAAGAGLLVADVTDPRHPVEVGALVTAGYAWGVAVDGATAYVADGWEGIETVNVANPALPVRQGTYKTPGWAVGVTVLGTTAYVADAFHGLRVLDVADPQHPREVASSEAAGGHAGSVAVAGNTAFVADRNWGVRAVNLSAGPDLPQVGSFHSMGYADGVTVSGTLAYIAAANGGLAVIDISDPKRPRQVSSVEVEGNAHDVVVRGSIAYLTTQGPGSAALHVINVSDPTRPVHVGFFLISNGQCQGLDIAGKHAYVPIEAGLEILNIADPAHPDRSAFLRTQEKWSDPEVAVGVTVAGTLAYVALQTGGLAIVDVSDPTKPVRRGTFNPGLSFLAQEVAVSANRAFVADTRFGLRVLDISDPDHPVQVGSLVVHGPESLALAGSLAYLAIGSGMLVVNISNPSQPALVGSFRSEGYSTRKVAVADGRAYLADGTNGLLILEKAAGASTRMVEVDQTGATNRPPSATRPAFLRPSHRNPRQAAAGVKHDAAESSPQAAGTFVVTSLADSGAGTLREALLVAGSGTTITFDPGVFPPSAPASIRLASGLPGIPGGVLIDGSDAGVILDGTGVSISPGHDTDHGLFFPSDGAAIRGLQILGFPGNGVVIFGSRNIIGGDRTSGRGPIGQGNVISGNRDAGIMITADGGGAARENVVVGNFIGTNADGTKAMGNGMDGVWVQRGKNNRIGGPDLLDRNIVSGNAFNGFTVSGQSTENLIVGNYVGTDVTGTFALANGQSGLVIFTGAFGNVVRGNLISGNLNHGVFINDAGSSYNAIVGNRMGTDATGTRVVPNNESGVLLHAAPAGFNRIGGTRPEDRNVISGNLGSGIMITTSNNLVLGNFIGTDISGRNPLGNAHGGVEVASSRNMIGGATPQEANVISGNGSGVSAGASHNTILGDYIGTDPSGQNRLGNVRNGVYITARHTVIQGNVIANTTAGTPDHWDWGSGVSVGAESDCTTIRRNSIHHNAGVGIETAETPAPILTNATATEVTGTACKGCEIEIFSDAEDEGRLFEGSTSADGSGIFTFTKAGGLLTGPNVSATATETGGRTSGFSRPMTLPPKPPKRRAVRH